MFQTKDDIFMRFIFYAIPNIRKFFNDKMKSFILTLQEIRLHWTSIDQNKCHHIVLPDLFYSSGDEIFK
jgi:hypothetical protein